MKLLVSQSGVARCIYGEAIELSALGSLSISRASHVEPTPEGKWTADMSPCGGPLLGPFEFRSEALSAEVAWLDNWLEKEGR